MRGRGSSGARGRKGVRIFVSEKSGALKERQITERISDARCAAYSSTERGTQTLGRVAASRRAARRTRGSASHCRQRNPTQKRPRLHQPRAASRRSQTNENFNDTCTSNPPLCFMRAHKSVLSAWRCDLRGAHARILASVGWDASICSA
eukprot:737512-Pleurochrysis_carterae.AAC.2